VIWPDFTRLPSAERPMLELVPFAIGDMLELNGKRIEVLSGAHRAGGGAGDAGGLIDSGWPGRAAAERRCARARHTTETNDAPFSGT